MAAENLRERKRGKDVRADNVVIAVGYNVVVHPVCTGGDVFVDGRSLAEQVVFFFGFFISSAEKFRRVQIDPRVPVGNEFGGALGDKQQCVDDVAGLPAALIDFLNGPGAGIVSGAGVAAENQRVHVHASFRPVRRV